jgi:riboflavin transporter FmnP
MEGQGPTREPRDTPWMLIVFGVLAAYAIAIVLLNAGEVQIHFVFFKTRISKVVLILVCLALGFAAGFIANRIRERRRRAA